MPMERTLPGPTVGEIYCVVKPPKKNLTESIILQTNVESIFCIMNSIGLVNRNYCWVMDFIKILLFRHKIRFHFVTTDFHLIY